MTDTRKSVLITGCSPGGIGHSLALSFHARGARVLATARSASTLSDLADRGIECLSLEVHKAESIKACVEEVARRTGGRLDYLVNNAGRNYTVPATDVDMEEIRQTFEVNVFAVMAMCQAFTPLLIEAKGHIVQIGSVAGIMPYVFGSVYNASKAALHQYTSTLRVELAPFDVTVTTVVTAAVTSNIARTHRSLPENSLYLPVADEYERRLTHSQANGMSNERYAGSVVGQVWGRDGEGTGKYAVWEGGRWRAIWLMMRLLPEWVHNAIFYRMFKLWKLEPRYAGEGAKGQ